MVVHSSAKATVVRLDRDELEARVAELEGRLASMDAADRTADAVITRDTLMDDISDLKWMLASAR